MDAHNDIIYSEFEETSRKDGLFVHSLNIPWCLLDARFWAGCFWEMVCPLGTHSTVSRQRQLSYPWNRENLPGPQGT